MIVQHEGEALQRLLLLGFSRVRYCRSVARKRALGQICGHFAGADPAPATRPPPRRGMLAGPVEGGGDPPADGQQGRGRNRPCRVRISRILAASIPGVPEWAAVGPARSGRRSAPGRWPLVNLSSCWAVGVSRCSSSTPTTIVPALGSSDLAKAIFIETLLRNPEAGSVL